METSTDKALRTMTEKGRWMRIGWLPFYLRPLTLAQVQEIGSAVRSVSTDGLQEGEIMLTTAMEHHADLGAIRQVVKIAVFRSSLMRKLMGWIIDRNTTSRIYREIFTHIQGNFDYAFFLTSLVFIKGLKTRTKQDEEQSE